MKNINTCYNSISRLELIVPYESTLIKQVDLIRTYSFDIVAFICRTCLWYRCADFSMKAESNTHLMTNTDFELSEAINKLYLRYSMIYDKGVRPPCELYDSFRAYHKFCSYCPGLPLLMLRLQ